MLKVQLVIDQKPIEPAVYHSFNQILLDREIVFPTKISELSYNSMIVFSIWSLYKKFDHDSPLGSTSVTLFDEELRLRSGNFLLNIWPLTKPDYRYDSLTPGLLKDDNIQEAQRLTRQIDYYHRYESQKNNIFTTLSLKRNQTFQIIPSAFLEIKFDFQQNNIPILFEEKSVEYFEVPQAGGIKKQQSLKNEVYVSNNQTEFDECIIACDFDYQANMVDPAEQLFQLQTRDESEVNPQDLKPGNTEMSQLKKAVRRPLLRELSTAEKTLFYKYRYALKDDGEYLIYFLNSVDWKYEPHREEALRLLDLWAPCDYGDALHLLSSFYCQN